MSLCFEPITIDAAVEFDTERLLNLFWMFKWKNPQDAMLLLGWNAIAPICGILEWRPHIWIHGKKETGKTTLHEILKITCSPLALSCDGSSSEAGIRQRIGPDSLPVIIDEIEGDQQHIKGILRLARSASSAEDEVLRGTPEGKAMGFCLRTTVAFSSINPLGMSDADESRIVMLDLVPHDNSTETANKIIDEMAYFREQQGKWCSMMVTRAPLVVEAVKKFEAVIKSGNRRHRLNMAMLLAGAFVALNNKAPDQNDVDEWANLYADTIKLHIVEREDDQECLDHLFAHMVRSNNNGEFPLGHWIAVSKDETGEGLSDARQIIQMYDMLIVWDDDKKGRTPGFYIKNARHLSF